jgi:hypothetical protein
VNALAFLAVLSVTAACGSSAPPAAESAEAEGATASVARYLPLQAGTVLAYDTLNETTAERGVVMLQVRRPRAHTVELDDGGRVQRLELVADGVRHSTGGYWLQLPIRVGTQFKGQFGKVMVTKLNRRIEVPAGKFTGCLETVEQDPTGSKQATTVFCPDVGMVSFEVEGTSGKLSTRVRFLLRSYGPKVDINNLPEALKH